MKRLVVSLSLILAVGMVLFSLDTNAQMGPGMMGPGYGKGPGYGPGAGGYEDWNCPYCGQYMGPRGGYGMGPGMMGRGYGMGPGMMGPGYGMGPGMMGPGYGPQYGPQYGSQKPLEQKDVKAMLENYLQSTRNPNLKLGKITEKGQNFEAEIVTKDNSLVDKILVDKNTGWMRSD